MKKQKSKPVVAKQDLDGQAMSQMDAAHYKDAIRLFKKLLQTDDNKEWKQKLAYCYVQRAMQFAAKGMYKEALVLWENHMPFAEAPYDANEQYIFWLIQTNNQANIQASLGGLSVQQLDKQYPALASVLGLLMLTEHPEFAQNLPQDSVFIAHYNIVQAALQAYQNNDSVKLAETLKLLPYRSAFRDFRTLLNATVLMSTSAQQAKALLAKIPANSAYFKPAIMLLACFKEGAELAGELAELNQQQCSVIGEIKGLNKKQLDFIQHFSRHYNKLTDKVQFKLAIQFKSLLGTEFAGHFCQGILTSYPAGKKDFNRHFVSVSEFEEMRIKALNCERKDDLYRANDYWRKCVDILDANTSADDDFKKALILRHMAAKEGDGEERTDLLEESLDYDPGDRQSYLHILQYYSGQADEIEVYNNWLAKTLKQFPQDVEVLTQAINVAKASKSNAKVSEYADRILKIDPLNTFAKQTLFTGHLAQARRLIKKKTYQSVEKEISKAEELNLGKACQKQIQLLRALLCFASEDKKQGLQRIVEELDVLHENPVTSHFQATVEALLNNLPVATILRVLPSANKHLLSTEELSGFIQQLEQYAADIEAQDYLHKALEKVKTPLKKSLSEQEYPEKLFISLCKVLDNINHFELLRHCIKSIRNEWGNPVWKYYQVYANTNGDATKCSEKQVSQLRFVLGDVRAGEDFQTGMLIERYLKKYYDAHPPKGFGFFDQLFGGHGDDDEDDDEFYDPMEELFGHLYEDEMDRLTEQVDILMKKLTPEKLIQSLIRKVGNRESILLAVMEDPLILSALMLLKAADELRIDIDVDIDDVIDAFEIDEKSKSFPFPF